MFSHRPVKADDFVIIAGFPRSKTEAFYMYPKGTFPLTAEQLQAAVSGRKNPTVITLDDEVVGYGNFYDVTDEDCWLGNVIVSPSCRGRGAGSYLVQTMKDMAQKAFRVKYLRLVCHNTNTAALLLYAKHGFVPSDLIVMCDPEGRELAGILMQAKL